MEELEMKFPDEQERKWDSQIDEARLRASNEEPPARITSARFDEDHDVVRLVIDDGSQLVIPRGNFQLVADATPEQARDVEIFMLGTAINWPQLDMPFSLEGLREGRYGNQQWMSELAARRRILLQKAS
jgi:hypothetical protein